MQAKLLFGNREGKHLLPRPGCRWKDFNKTWCKAVQWIYLVTNRVMTYSCKPSGPIWGREFLDLLGNY